MNAKSVLSSVLLITIMLIINSNNAGTQTESLTSTNDERVKQDSILRSYRSLPLSFEMSKERADGKVDFISRGLGYGLFLTPNEAIIALNKSQETKALDNSFFAFGAANHDGGHTNLGQVDQAAIQMRLIGANATPTVSGVDELPGTVNYFFGSDQTEWKTNVSSFQKVLYEDVYSGINLIYYGNQTQLEYDFVIAPGATPDLIGLYFDGADKLELNADGELILHIASEQIRMLKPTIYQEIDGLRQEIWGGYLLKADDQVSFQVGRYDNSRPLVIDPVIVYSTYFGGIQNEQEGYGGFDVDSNGHVYITGRTYSTNLPLSNAIDSGLSGETDAFVAKIDPQTNTLIYSSYFGGSRSETGNSVVTDDNGNAFAVGYTNSLDFPIVNAFQPQKSGYPNETIDTFILKLNSTGSNITYSTYLGGSGADDGWDISINSLGEIIVAGNTQSSDFPVVNALQSEGGDVFSNTDFDVFVTKIHPSGSSLIFSTYLGRGSNDVVRGLSIDNQDNIYITGYAGFDYPTTPAAYGGECGSEWVFVSKITPNGEFLDYSTCIGPGRAWGIAVDNFGSAYITGQTNGSFPLINAYDAQLDGNYDTFVTKLSPTGDSLMFSTYLGGSIALYAPDNGQDWGNAIDIDEIGNVYVTGFTNSVDFPVVNAIQPSLGDSTSGAFDAFIAKFDPTGANLLMSTYLGGNFIDAGFGIIVEPNGVIYVRGETNSTNFPVVNPFQSNLGGIHRNDAFIVKIVENPPLLVDAGGPYFVNEGGTVVVAASSNYPNEDQLSYAWDLDNNGTFETPGQSVTFSAESLSAPSNYSIRVQATDNGGLTATDEANVIVIYNFDGFFPPVDNPPTFNMVKAGQAIPVKFSLNGDQGLNIFATGYPKSQSITCDSTAPVDGIEVTVTAGNSSLSYDPVTDTYTYVWKTDKSWANTCRQLVVKLNDDTFHRANFKFTK
jgi:hypothetical protein